MTIEITHPVGNAKVASFKEPSGTKAKSGSAESGKTQKLPGFMAILAAADEPALAGLTLGDSDSASAGSALVASDAAVDSEVPGADMGAASDAATLLAQALQWAATLMGGPGHPSPDPANGKSAAPEIDPANGPCAIAGIDPAIVSSMGPALGFGAAAKQPSSPPLKSGGVAVAGNAASSSVAVGAQGASASEAVGMPRKAGKDVKDTAALQSAAVASAGNSAVEAGRADDRSMKFIVHDMLVKPGLVQAEPALQMVATTVKREEQSIHGAAKANAAMDVAASWGGTRAVVGGAAGYSAASLSDASALTPAYVAEQVSYWISNDVQSAEIKLQGLGDSPVAVRISMVGNEAHVAFRTDEAQARDALENASAHLKEMLQRDGVVLSGVSVGTSGSGGAGGQEQQPRHGRQKTVVMVEVPLRVETRALGTAQAGRALDLFV